LLVATLVGFDIDLGHQPAIGVQDRRSVAVAVGVDPDDGIDLSGVTRDRTVRSHDPGRTGF
jgi:hypothetical protein